jgi:hypothetical protein
VPRNSRPKIQNVVLVIRIPKSLRDGLKRVAAKQLCSMASVARGALLREVAECQK